MAIIALHSASSGLNALNTKLDVIANNLANISTAGFKSSRANFQDLLYMERAQPGDRNANNDQRPTGIYVGLGVRVAGTQVDFQQGPLITTNKPLDLAIENRGFFRVNVQDDLAANGVAYTRAGQFTLNSDGEMVMASQPGRRLTDGITIPDDAINVTIDANGRVFVTQPGQAEPSEVGQLETAVFVNPTGLKQIGENLFAETGASGAPIVGTPGEGNHGQIVQGAYENSNVDPTGELIHLIRTQRAFELNSQTIRAADEALGTVAQLRR